jgi:hypothetical protein
LRLWRDALDALGIPVEGLTRSRPGLEKYLLPTPQFTGTAMPLHAVYHLERVTHPRHSGVRRLAGPQSVAAAASRIWLRGSLMPLGLADGILRAAGRVATVPGGSWQINSLHSRPGLELAVDTICELAGT